MKAIKRALLLVDHGSRVAKAHSQFEQVAMSLAERLRQGDKNCIVGFAHMEIASPRFDEAVACCVEQGAQDILVIPCFFAAGRHLTRDIPELVSEAELKYPQLTLKVAPSMYELESFVDLLLETSERY